MSPWIYLNGRFVTREDAKVSVFDHGFLYGDGVYETLRAYNKRIFMLEKHLSRLRRSAQFIGLELPLADKDWPGVLAETLDRNALADAAIRITISRGEGEIGLDPRLCSHPTVVVLAWAFKPYPPEQYSRGVHLAVVSVRRNSASALSPQIKSLNFLNNILAKREATASGAFDAIMLNADGHLAECTVSNLFFVRHDVVRTPSTNCGILDGITREVVIVLARENGIAVEEGAYPPESVMEADECFVTNTGMEVMPVSQIDGRKIGSGEPGPITRKLGALFRENFPRFLS